MSTPTKDEIFARVKALLVELFEVDAAKVQLDAQLYQDLEVDSIDAIDLILQLKDYTGRKVRPEDFKHVRSVGDVVDAVQALFASA